MKQAFSTKWAASKQPRKQRKYRFNAPLHIRSKFVRVNLAKDLRKKYNVRSVRVRKDDVVKVMRGTHKGKTGKVLRVSVKDTKVHIEGVEAQRKDGTKSYYSFEPSNLQITQVGSTDKRRFKSASTAAPTKKDEKKETKND